MQFKDPDMNWQLGFCKGNGKHKFFWKDMREIWKIGVEWDLAGNRRKSEIEGGRARGEWGLEGLDWEIGRGRRGREMWGLRRENYRFEGQEYEEGILGKIL